MSATFIAAVLFLISMTILCGPPALALRMLVLRLRRSRPQSRMVYGMLCAIALLVLAFNVLVAFGADQMLRALTPPVVAENLGTTALLFAWVAVGICGLLAVIAPHRRRASHI